ncbi:OmpA family protein [Puniceicoccaceae bacterium K14]|nr:OmpA family protein [Puniceicoccaceae bacterium K14]
MSTNLQNLGKHHGGAWKVAYADFVTAMMALFMVLWLTSQDDETRKEMADFFKDPYNTPMESSMGMMESSGEGDGESNAGQSKGKADIADVEILYRMAQEFMRLLNVDNVAPDERPVDIEVVSDGLRVTLYNRDAYPFFVKGSTQFTEWGTFVIENMAWLLERHDFMIRIDGYSASGFVSKDMDYTEWELSTGRANATRRYLQYYRVTPERFTSVTGYGSTKPLPQIEPEAESNNRVAISLVLNESFNKYDGI